MKLTDFKALTFDCYGTLIDWEAGLAAALRPWAAAHRLEMSDEDLLLAYAPHEAQAEADHPTAIYTEILARSMRALGAQLGVAVSEPLPPELRPSRRRARAIESNHVDADTGEILEHA